MYRRSLSIYIVVNDCTNSPRVSIKSDNGIIQITDFKHDDITITLPYFV